MTPEQFRLTVSVTKIDTNIDTFKISKIGFCRSFGLYHTLIDAFVAKIDGSATIDPLYLNIIVGNIANFDVKGMKLGSFTSQFAAFLLSFGLKFFFGDCYVAD